MFSRQHQSTHIFELGSGLKLIGNCIEVKESRNYILAFHRKNIIVSKATQVFFYTRARINKELIHSSLYSMKKVQKRNSYTVLLKDKNIFEIEVFAVVNKNEVDTGYAIGYYYELSNKKLLSKNFEHLIVLNSRNLELTVVSLDLVKEKVTILNSSSLNKSSSVCIS